VDFSYLVTQVPRLERGRSAAPTTFRPLQQIAAEGGRIVLLGRDGHQEVLTEDFHSAADPEVSFDGQRILFAAQRVPGDKWNIYEMDLAGRQLRQITRDCGNCRQPGYQATLYTIVSSEPWYQLTFVSDMAGKLNEAQTGVATSLYSCRMDGSEVRRLTYNLSDDADPFLMRDGRLLYAGWQRGTLKHGISGRVVLFGVNIDGTDHALFGDLRGLPVKRMPCVTDRGLVVYVESEFGADGVADLGAGQLAAVTFRRPLHSYRSLTSAEDHHRYRSPKPAPEGRVIVARRSVQQRGDFGICLYDPRSGESTGLLDEPDYDEVQAVVVRQRGEADGRSSVVNEEDPHGKLYCLNVNITDLADRSWHPPGTARRVRLLEGVPRDAALRRPTGRQGGGVTVGADAPGGIVALARRRILGEVDLESDGSFNVEIPANTSIELQTVDEHGVALRTSGWIWSKNHEPRGCIGCHEDGELTPENRLVDAMAAGSISLTLPVERRRTVDFRRDVMPIIQRKCVACHGRDGAPPRLDVDGDGDNQRGGSGAASHAYVRLLAERQGGGAEDAYKGRYVDPGRARTSPLIWHLFGRNLARPWDGPLADRPAKPIPASDQPIEPLTDLERRTFVEWVDLGALWDNLASDAASDDESSR